MNSTEEWLTRPNGLAGQLRELRRAARHTGVTLAADLGWTQSKVSKLENGKQVPTAQDITQWATACRAGDETTRQLLDMLNQLQVLRQDWQVRSRLSQVGIQHDYDQLARAASVVRNFESTMIPGLLQTPDYARLRLAEFVDLHGGNPDNVEDAVAARIHRQLVLHESGRRFEFVITEAVLTQLTAPADITVPQLERLLLVAAGLHNVWFGIVPRSRVPRRAPQHGFLLFDDVAVTETFIEELTYRFDAATRLAKVMDEMKDAAVTGDAARDLIVQAMQGLRE